MLILSASGAHMEDLSLMSKYRGIGPCIGSQFLFCSVLFGRILKKGFLGLGILTDAFMPHVLKLEEDLEGGLAEIIEKYDDVSVREYLRSEL